VRVVAVTVATIAVLMMGLALSQTPDATAAQNDRANAQIDPQALQVTIDIKSLPQQTTGDLI
jgi:hypothetical protein